MSVLPWEERPKKTNSEISDDSTGKTRKSITVAAEAYKTKSENKDYVV